MLMVNLMNKTAYFRHILTVRPTFAERVGESVLAAYRTCGDDLKVMFVQYIA